MPKIGETKADTEKRKANEYRAALEAVYEAGRLSTQSRANYCADIAAKALGKPYGTARNPVETSEDASYGVISVETTERVAYSIAWLRSVGAGSIGVASARGYITGLKMVGNGAIGTVLARVRWDGVEEEQWIAAINLAKVEPSLRYVTGQLYFIGDDE